jgi:hypothetical protein
MTSTQHDEEIAGLVPLLSTGLAPAEPTSMVGAAEPVVNAELLGHQRAQARRLAELTLSRCPAQWQDRVRAELVRQLICVPIRYRAAVGWSTTTAVRAWWAWASAQDFYDAAKQA